MMPLGRRGCPIRGEIGYSDNRVGIRRFKREERRGLIVGKLKIDVGIGCGLP